jgi:hypothetical protein
MALIVDDSIDVWRDDLSNLCLTRRFVGDGRDSGLMQLSMQLSSAHKAFYGGAPGEGYSFEVPSGSPRAPPSVFTVLADARGQLLRGCKIALTGIVTDLSEETLEGNSVPLGTLVQLYGGEITLSVDTATHLVARRKDGWQSSAKIRRALARLQEGKNCEGFFAVWDHWLLDTLASWQRPAERDYAIALEDERVDETHDATRDAHVAADAGGARAAAGGGAAADATGGEGLLSRKRPRPENDASDAAAVNG